MNASDAPSPAEAREPELSCVVIPLLKGVVDRGADPVLWSELMAMQAGARDYVRVLDLELIVDEAEGYAFLRSRAGEADGDEEAGSSSRRPRLVSRRPLSYPVSLLLALLRKKLAEFDASGGETRLVLSVGQIVEAVRVFSPSVANEARLSDQIETQINKVAEMGFLRKLKPAAGAPDRGANYEVKRILKAYVDGQWLGEFDARLEEYRKGAGDAGEEAR